MIAKVVARLKMRTYLRTLMIMMLLILQLTSLMHKFCVEKRSLNDKISLNPKVFIKYLHKILTLISKIRIKILNN